MYMYIYMYIYIYIYCGWLTTEVAIGVDTLPQLQHERTRSVLDTTDAEVASQWQMDANPSNRHQAKLTTANGSKSYDPPLLQPWAGLSLKDCR